MPGHGGGKVSFATAAGADKALEEVSRDLDRLPDAMIKYLKPTADTFNCRPIAGTGRMSMHAYGAAIDINTKYSAYWRWAKAGKDGKLVWSNKYPKQIIDIFERHASFGAGAGTTSTPCISSTARNCSPGGASACIHRAFRLSLQKKGGRKETTMKSVGRSLCAMAVIALFAEPALAAKPTKKDIANCAAEDVETVIKGCTAIFKKSPKNPAAQSVALYNRGLAHYRAGDYQKALADHDEGIEIMLKGNLNDRNLAYNLYLNRGRTKYQMKDWRGSAQDSEEATKVDATNPMAYTNWAWALLELEDYEEAKQQLDWSLAIKPDEPSGRALRGIVNFYLGNYPELLEDTNEALELNSNFPWALSNRALYYWWMSQSDLALKDLDAGADRQFQGRVGQYDACPHPGGAQRLCRGATEHRHGARRRCQFGARPHGARLHSSLDGEARGSEGRTREGAGARRDLYRRDYGACRNGARGQGFERGARLLRQS